MQRLRGTSRFQGKKIPNAARFAVVAVPMIVGVFAALAVNARSATSVDDRPAFAVASVKEDKSDRSGGMNIPLLGDVYTPTGGVFSGINVPLISYIYFAYNFTGSQFQLLLPRLPGWVTSEHFDIEARAEGDPTKTQMRLMMQSLLADRFKLAAHYETQQLPVYAAVISKPGRTGPQLRPHSDETPCSTVPPLPAAPGQPPQPATIAGGFPVVCGGIAGMPASAPGRMRVGGRNVPIGLIVSTLAQMGNFDRSVLDQTGLIGNFDFVVEWTPQRNGPPRPDEEVQSDDSGPAIMQALNEQLGLKLESKKGPVEVFVLDHIERPSGN